MSKEALLKIVSDIAGTSAVEGHTRLYHDLKISGDDACELLENVQKSFGTDFVGFKFNEYFPNEGETFGISLFRLFGYKDKEKPFTFNHLLKVVEDRRWSQPTA